MTCRVADRLPVALRGVGEAVRLDSTSRMTEAYVKYLACVIYVGQALIDDAARRDLWELSLPETMRFFKMASQCLERAAAVVESSLRKREDDSVSSPNGSEDACESDDLAQDEPVLTEQNWADVPPLSAIRSVGEQSGYSTPVGGNERDGPASPLPADGHADSLTPADAIEYSASPDSRQLAEALRKNEQLMKAYQARMKRIADNRGETSKTHFQVNFMLMRECQENIAIARSRQEALLQKMRLRQQRSALEGAKIVASPSLSSGGDEMVVDTDRICGEVVRFEENQAWSKELRTKIFSHPEETLYINDFIIKALSTNGHPLSSLMGQLQYDIYQRLLPLSNQHNSRSVEVDLQAINSRRAKRQRPVDIPRGSKFSTSGASALSTSCPQRQSVKARATVSTDATDGAGAVGGSSSVTVAASAPMNRPGHRRNVSSGGRLEHVVPDLSSPIVANANGPRKLRHQHSSHLQPTSLHPLMDSESSGDECDGEGPSDEDQFEKLSPQQLLARSLSSTVSAKRSTALPPPSMERVQRLISSWCTAEELEVAETVRTRLQTVTSCIHSYIDQLEACFMTAYAEMSTPAGRDQCRASIELRFFPPIWSLLLAAFRQANSPQEKTLAASMTSNYYMTTKEMQIPDRFCLLDHSRPDAQPYLAAVEQLQRITKLYCPLEKLECVVTVSRAICECAEQYWRLKRGKQVASKYATIGCDDLLPILGYVVVRSALPQLVSECCAMEEFIHEGYLMGEEGYCLTTLQTALTYVTCLAGDRPASKQVPV